MRSYHADMKIATRSGERSFTIEAHTASGLNLSSSVVNGKMLEREGLLDVPVTRLNGAVPMILIGQNNVELLITRGARIGKSRRVVASETAFGWIVEGQDREPLRVATHRCLLINNHEEQL